MVKKPILLVFGGSSAIVEELLKYFKKKYQIYVFYNKNVPKKNRNIKEKIKLNLFSDKELLSKIRKINFNNSKIVIVNFASIKIDKISLFINQQDIKRTFQINTFSFLKILQILLPTMMKLRWGRVINISSTGGLVGDKGTLLYSSSKNATHSMIKVMSKEYAAFNITFNTLKLGNFNFGLFKLLKKEVKEEILKKVPSHKTGNVKNIYNAIKFLIESDYVNGSSIKIDGGL
jgi:NAD(P)-dependent dehydrogenase (short-subunit alcohol dehydrogenase family)|tara:strand:- start:1198 stop:1893 length:696 start_codon:yes stop_codon:yes gene_type:complete